MDQLFRALAHPVRRQILSKLRDSDLTSGEIAKLFDFSWPTITDHLSVLKAAGLVKAVREKAFIVYSIDPEPLGEAIDFMRLLKGASSAG